ncbi:MAG: polyphosphate polymerase domain-containing protein [Roseburia sp.]|nr:polyphosphate polymerase domain-containing protein [Roseburia sp.]MCM1278761.1 polyphosphate polymerase domain-containing protein [Robinsoniella sp.]
MNKTQNPNQNQNTSPNLVSPPKKYRHELKYLCGAADIPLLKARLKGIAGLDSHVGEKGYYHIRSLYFDDYNNTCYKMNEAGVDNRMKYRIRIYNYSDKQITLEKKIKVHGMTRKLSAPLTREQCNLFLQGKNLSMGKEALEGYPKLLQEFVVWMAAKQGKPKIIVAYDRIPYVYKQGNVRITIDENIQSSKDFARFFERDMQKSPILPKGKVLVEVKYDELLPSFLKERLEIGRLQQTTFSKYYLCRRFFAMRH